MQRMSRLDVLGMRVVDAGWVLLEIVSAPGPVVGGEELKRRIRRRAWELIELGGQVEEQSAVIQQACQTIKLGHSNHHTGDKIIDLQRVREQRKEKAALLLAEAA